MATGKSFWASVPGLVTGAAGVLTAVVGLLTLGVAGGWIGDGGGRAGAGRAEPATAAFDVQPAAVEFATVPLPPREAMVTVHNTGDVALTLRPPAVEGGGAAQFRAADVSCALAPLAPGRTCELRVTFSPMRGGQLSAVLVVAAAEATRASEVPLRATTLLG